MTPEKKKRKRAGPDMPITYSGHVCNLRVKILWSFKSINTDGEDVPGGGDELRALFALSLVYVETYVWFAFCVVFGFFVFKNITPRVMNCRRNFKGLEKDNFQDTLQNENVHCIVLYEVDASYTRS
jgi:hypothetical protein